MNNELLNDDWAECTLGEICTIQTGKYDANHAKDDGKYRFYTCAFDYLKCDTNRFSGKSIILPGNGANVGEVFFYDGQFDAYQRTYVLNQIKINPKYLFYHMSGFWKIINLDKQFGTATNYIRMGNFTNYNVPIYSLPTQKAIVKKIEELFSSLDSGIADLKKAQDQLKIYRQAVLKKAFEGELTNTEIKFSNQINNGDLPINWNWASIFDFLFDKKKGMATGPFGTALKKHEHKQEGVPVLGIENIGEGKFKMPNKIFVSTEKSKELKSFKVLENDIIISRSGTVGEICAIPKNMENSLISTNLIRVRLDLEQILPKFFVYLFQGGNVREQVKELCKGSTRVFLNQTILKKLKLPFCSIDEQKEVIKAIESRLSVCDKVEKDIADSLEKAQALRQSILKKAFEGKLLSEEEITACKQHKDYEPANVLLEKIKAENKK